MKQTSTPAELAQALEEWAPKFEAMMNPGHVHPYAVLLRASAQALRRLGKVEAAAMMLENTWLLLERDDVADAEKALSLALRTE